MTRNAEPGTRHHYIIQAKYEGGDQWEDAAIFADAAPALDEAAHHRNLYHPDEYRVLEVTTTTVVQQDFLNKNTIKKVAP